MRRSAVRFRYRARDEEISPKRDSFFVVLHIFWCIVGLVMFIVGVEALEVKRLRGLGCPFWGRARARLRDDVMGLRLGRWDCFAFEVFASLGFDA